MTFFWEIIGSPSNVDNHRRVLHPLEDTLVENVPYLRCKPYVDGNGVTPFHHLIKARKFHIGVLRLDRFQQIGIAGNHFHPESAMELTPELKGLLDHWVPLTPEQK